ncbi:MAG: ATP-binding protein, partial [Pseudomonadota bacterium]
AEIGNSVRLGGRDGYVDEKSIWSLFHADTLVATAPIRVNGVLRANLAIHSQIGWLRDNYATKLTWLITLTLAGGLITALIANHIIKNMLRPLKTLSKSLSVMQADADLSVRFDAARHDEIGVLASAFNSAFETIEKQNTALRVHRDTLEMRVKERTEQLRTAVQEAERANAAKSDFLATMSHEIRTPMNGMMVMAELLASTDLQPKQRHYTQVINRSGNALLNIINDVLDMSKIEAGRLELEAIPFDLEMLVNDAVSLFSARAGEKGIALVSIVEPAVASRFIGDPTRLSQVINNLTNNAIKFTEQGGVTIRVSVDRETADTQRVCLEVQDTGIGISEDKLETVFDAFSQADQSTNRKYGGTGLGLAICKRLVDGMGGEITVESAMHTGAVFKVLLELPIHERGQFEPVTKSLHVGVCIGNPVYEAAIYAWIQQWEGQPRPLDDELCKMDLVIADDANSQQRKLETLNAPLVLISPLQISSNTSPSSVKPSANLTYPVTRADLKKVLRAVETAEWDALDLADNKLRPQTAEPDFADIQILAVDDNPVNRQVITDALSAIGAHCDLAASGQDAIELCETRTYDLVFMDCSMPIMDGYEATRLIRRLSHKSENNTQTMRIVALTADASGEEAGAWREAGMDAFMTKPFQIDDLKRELSIVAAKTPKSLEENNGDRTEVTVRASQPTDQGELELLSSDTLAMFEMVKSTTGTNMIMQVFPMFIASAEEAMQAIDNAVTNAADASELRSLAHGLKSMCSSAGAQRAASLAETVELRAGEKLSVGDVDLQSLRDAIRDTISAMDDIIKSEAASEPDLPSANTH